jgi:hypothetical protein
MRKQLIAIVAGVMLSASAANADPTSCREAADHYKSAVAEVSETVRNYTTCVSDSRGHDSCSTEFLQLQQAQDGFESAVSEYESECS